MENAQTYPVTLSVDYPDTARNKLTVGLRMFTIIPIAAILALLMSGNHAGPGEGQSWVYWYGVTLVIWPTVLMILFRQKYPRWWFDWNVALTSLCARVATYGALLRDEYPSTDEEQAVHLTIPYPNVKEELQPGLPLIKWFLAIPHWIVLWFLWIAVGVVTVVAWFVILFTGVYPKDLFHFVVGVMRWSLRVTAYAALMVTDIYPPFTLSA